MNDNRPSLALPPLNGSASVPCLLLRAPPCASCQKPSKRRQLLLFAIRCRPLPPFAANPPKKHTTPETVPRPAQTLTQVSQSFVTRESHELGQSRITACFRFPSALRGGFANFSVTPMFNRLAELLKAVALEQFRIAPEFHLNNLLNSNVKSPTFPRHDLGCN